MPTLASTYYKGKKMHGLRSKIWNHLTRFVPRAHRCVRSRFSEAEDARTHQFDFLARSPLPRGRSLGQERAQLSFTGAENMTRAQCHWSPRARGLKSPSDEHHVEWHY